MEIKKGSFWYNVAYGSKGYTAPSATNLCKFFWEVIFMLLIGWPAIYLLIILGYVIGFLFSVYPNIGNERDAKLFVYY